MKNLLIAFVLIMTSTLSLQAQTPQGFNYQATVRNADGALIVNQNVNFRFNVQQGSATSEAVFTETHLVSPDDLGQVNLVIGDGTATTGNFSQIDWSLGSYFLGIEINTGAGYVAMGTTQLLSVPFALYAENSGNDTVSNPTLDSVLAENSSANNQQIKDLADPTDDQDAVTKIYTYSKIEVDALLASLTEKIDYLENLNGSGTVTDIDGNTYEYLSYGNQKWTVENAAMETYRDGTPIPQVTDPTIWAALTTGAWCYYDNDATKGTLYNAYAAQGIHDNDPNTPNKVLAPEGWHVPSIAEWVTLADHLIANGYNYDGTTTVNRIAKAMASTTGWSEGNTEYAGSPRKNQSLNNSSGFNAFPEGVRTTNGESEATFSSAGWIASFYGYNQDENAGIIEGEAFIFGNHINLHTDIYEVTYLGLSVRLVKGDNPSDTDEDGDGYTENQGDCDDTNANINPDIEERFDGIDNDCNGIIDDGVCYSNITGKYSPSTAEYWRLGEQLANASNWPIETEIIYVCNGVYRVIEYCGLFPENNWYFEVETDEFGNVADGAQITYPALTPEGNVQLLNGNPLITCENADLSNVNCNISNYVSVSGDNVTLTMSFGYFMNGSGSREFYQKMNKN